MNKTIFIIVILLLVVVGGYFLLKGDGQAPALRPAAPEATTPEEAPEAAAPVPGETDVDETIVIKEPSVSEVLKIAVVGTEFAFNPSTITVQSGQQIVINFENLGGSNHNLVIEGLGISTRIISGGQTDAIEFTASTPGTYAIFCSVPGHRGLGMEGALVVE